MDETARNLATAQRGWDAFNATNVTVEGIRRGDLKQVLEVFDRGVVLDVTDVGVPGLGRYFGHRGVRQFWTDWFEVVGDVHTNVLEMKAAGDKVVSICRQTGSGLASGAAVTWEFAIVCTMRDGRIVRMDMYADLDEAREVAGVTPGAAEPAEAT